MNKPPHADAPLGIFDSLRTLLDTVLSILVDRSELFTTELEDGLIRLIRVLLWGVAAVLAVIVGATFLSAALLLAAPDEYRALSAVGLAFVFLIFGGIAYLAIRKNLRSMSRPFAGTLRELEKDRNRLRSRR